MARKKNQQFPFSRRLLAWHAEENHRSLPWKGEKDPYKIWLSEIILQQTRAGQGIKYYQKLVAAYPNIYELANAPDREIYKLWEGLGYYSRCKNAIHTARQISENLSGQFPNNYEELKLLKGIGSYTAAAIASFAFNEPCAVVDGNVLRVLARLYGIPKPIDSAEGKKFFCALANELLDKKQPGLYNQAIMDFGAMICKPAPTCSNCPFMNDCLAFKKKKVLSYPVKRKTILTKERWLNYVVLECGGKYAIRQRTAKDIWHNLFEFFLIESGALLGEKQLLGRCMQSGFISSNNGSHVISSSPVFRQQLTHQLINGRFTRIKLKRKPKLIGDLFWINRNEIKKYPFPKVINQYLEHAKI